MEIQTGQRICYAARNAAYLAKHLLSSARDKVWRAIVACRAAILGGHVETCDSCGVTRHVYYSWRNRHCRQCQTRTKEHWLAKRPPGAAAGPVFPSGTHAVAHPPCADWTTPAGDLRDPLRRRVPTLAEFAEFAANPRWLSGKLAFSLVLHTWKQDLGLHVHVYALVAGGALIPEGEWKSPKRGFLFPVKALSRVFRGKSMRTTEQGRGAARVTLGDVLGSRPPGVDASTRRRSQGSDPGLPQPDGPLDSGEALVNPAPARPNPTRGLTQAPGRLQSP